MHSPNSHVVQPAPPDPDARLYAHSDPENNRDSGIYGGGSCFTFTASTSIAHSVMNYKYENGRRYHAFKEGEYLLPNDDREQDRLDLLHHIFKLCLDGHLFRAPITQNPQRVLDMGTGTGIWVIDFADEFPSAMVVGNDLSPIQPSWVPPNCRFVIDDHEAEWVYAANEKFDFVHGRGMAGSVADFDRLYRQAFKHIKPGGWIEIQEYEAGAMSDYHPEQGMCPNIKKWGSIMEEVSTKHGKNLNIAHEQKQRLIDAGFVDVQDDIYRIPIGPWTRDAKLKEIGLFELEQMIGCVESYTLALLTRVEKWSYEETVELIDGVCGELQDWKKNHLYKLLHFVYGRKPEDAT